MILSDDMILNTDKIIFSDLLPHVQPVRSHWQPFAFRHSLGTLAITSIFSLSSYFNFHNWFTALTWKAVHPNLIPVDLLAFTFSTPLSLSMHQFHFQYNFSTPLSHSQDHFHNTTFFSEGHFHFLNTTFTFSIPLSLSKYHFHFLCNKFHFLNVTFNISSQTHFLFLKITFTTPLSFFWRSPSLSQHNFLFLNITFTFSPHPGSCSSRPSAAWSSFPSFSSATTDLRGLKDFGRSVFDIIVDKTIMMLIAQVLFHWDGLYWFFVILFGVSGGYTASLALMYCPRWSSSSPSTSAYVQVHCTFMFQNGEEERYLVKIWNIWSTGLLGRSMPPLPAWWAPLPSGYKSRHHRLCLLHCHDCHRLQQKSPPWSYRCLQVGILLGLLVSCLMPLIISAPALDWELPGFWPQFHPD